MKWIKEFEPDFYKTEVRKGKKVLHTMLIPADEIQAELTEQDGLFRTPLYTQEKINSLLEQQKQESYKEGVQFGVKNHDLLKSEWFEYFEYNEETISLQDFIDKKLTNTKEK